MSVARALHTRPFRTRQTAWPLYDRPHGQPGDGEGLHAPTFLWQQDRRGLIGRTTTPLA
jgi:hypothetical protein